MHSPRRLNYLFQATAYTAMVRSSMLVPMGTIGAARLAVIIRASLLSVAAFPSWTLAIEQWVSLFVA